MEAKIGTKLSKDEVGGRLPARVQRQAADHLHVVVAEPKHAPSCFAHHGERLVQDVLLRLTILRFRGEWG